MTKIIICYENIPDYHWSQFFLLTGALMSGIYHWYDREAWMYIFPFIKTIYDASQSKSHNHDTFVWMFYITGERQC